MHADSERHSNIDSKWVPRPCGHPQTAGNDVCGHPQTSGDSLGCAWPHPLISLLQRMLEKRGAGLVFRLEASRPTSTERLPHTSFAQHVRAARRSGLQRSGRAVGAATCVPRRLAGIARGDARGACRARVPTEGSRRRQAAGFCEI
eukprot:352048-Chlamydomonas_euryale.AAC.1